MREIKFKQALFNKDGSFWRWHFWGFTKDGLFVGAELGISTHSQALTHSWQYIGHKDKNGVDIYLGDFVKTDIDDEIAEVAFDNNDDQICCLYGEDCYIDCAWEKFERIGDRYETPELIKSI